MALRLRRDVQKASYYVWFLGAEEAKGLRGARVINAALPYLIDRSRSQEPLKVTLQVSHKGIKILQGASKHFIPHSAITSSLQGDDIVACVLLLYNPVTKCPLHVHAYRCDSETTAEALHQHLQILINRPENQKRFEELETRLGIAMPLPGSSNQSTTHNSEHNQSQPFQSQHQQSKQQKQRRHEISPKRFNSSLGSDTGNSTRESECSEEHGGHSPISRSPPVVKPLPQQNNELFDSLAAELRAKLNGNGPPLLLPPRDYDTVHRSKGNLTAIELRRCRNALIVGGGTKPSNANTATQTAGGLVNAKQVSSRGSSGIGSDLAPSPERQEINSSSDDEHWTNEADNSVIALKPSQVPIDRSAPLYHPQLNRKSAVQPPDDSYLRDLPIKPYNQRHNNSSSANNHIKSNNHKISNNNNNNSNSNNNNNSIKGREKIVTTSMERDIHSKTPSSTSWSREDEIKPIIMRPADYDAKFNRILLAEQKHDNKRDHHPKLSDTDKYNEINRLLSKKLSLDCDTPIEQHHKINQQVVNEQDDSDPSNEQLHAPYKYNVNLTDKQKFIEYTSSNKQHKSQASDEVHRYGGRHRYVDPADLPFEQPARNKYAAIHRHSPELIAAEIGHRTSERHHDGSSRRSSNDREKQREFKRGSEQNREREREREKDRERGRENEREREREEDRDRGRQRNREFIREHGHERDIDRKHDHDRRQHERERFSCSNERNPYKEPESIPYIQSMEKMMKSSAMRYKSFEGVAESQILHNNDLHTKVNQRSKSYPKQDDEIKIDRNFNYKRNRNGYDPSTTTVTNVGGLRERFKDAKEKFRAMERSGSRYDLTDKTDDVDYKPRRRGSIEPPIETGCDAYEDWSDKEHFESTQSMPVNNRPRSRSREHWEQNSKSMHDREVISIRREIREHYRDRDYERDVMPREMSTKRLDRSRDMRDHPREQYRGERQQRYDLKGQQQNRENRNHEYEKEHMRRDYSPELGLEHNNSEFNVHSIEKRRIQRNDMYKSPSPSPSPSPNNGAPMLNAKSLTNMAKGFRHSYAEPVLQRTGGRVGLAAVNPY